VVSRAREVDEPSTVVVREARRGDADAIVDIDRLVQTPAVSPGDPPDPSQPGDPFGAHGPGDTQVAVVDDVVMGYVVLGRPTPLRANRHVWTIQGLAVHPDGQGRGIGRMLVGAAVDEARRRGGTRVTLRVLGGNVGARRLYEATGFVVEGVLVGEFVLDGVEVDDVLMARRLDASAPPGSTAGE